METCVDKTILNKIIGRVDELKNEGFKAIVFWMPALNIGGGAFYLAELAKFLDKYTNIDIYFVDYLGGYPTQLLKGSNVKFITYSINLINLPIQEKCLLITNTTRVIHIPKMHPESKLLFWHYETTKCAWNKVIIDKNINSYFKLLKNNNALVYHDASARLSLNSFDNQKLLNKDYLYITIPPKIKSCESKLELINNKEINVAWLGRIAHDKIESIKYLVKNLNACKTDKLIKFNIIGDGPLMNNLREYCKNYTNIEFNFIGLVIKEDLDDCLIKNADILFAVGTSVLEGASLKIPSANLFLSYNEISDDSAIWLFDSKEKTLGILDIDKEVFDAKYTKISEMIEGVIQNKKIFSQKTYEYYKENHSSFENLVFDFLGYFKKSSLTFRKLRKYLKYTPYKLLKYSVISFWNVPIYSKSEYDNEIRYKFLGIPFYRVKKPGNYRILFFKFIKNSNEFSFLFFKFKKKELKANLLFTADKVNDIPKFLKDLKIKQIKEINSKDVIKVCLLTSRPNMWCFNGLLKLLQKDNKFDPVVVIMPDPYEGKNVMAEYVNKTYENLKLKGIEAIKGYDEENDQILDLRKEIDPDVIFYDNFWKPHIPDSFYITNFSDKLTFLCEYGFSCMQDELTCGFEVNKLVTAYFRPTNLHKEMAKGIMANKASNVVVSGSPKLECLLGNHQFKDIWPTRKKNKVKRIIWAPHHTLSTPPKVYQCNGFIYLFDEMLKIANKYKDELQIAFRPHPMLKEKLVKLWGEDKQQEYYNKWNELENTMFYEGDFTDLFYYSDAMIMDSCSFLAEYTAFNKPLFYTITPSSRHNFNQFGEEIMEICYKTENELYSDLYSFIENVVINGNDDKEEAREEFVQKYFMRGNSIKTPSEIMYNQLQIELMK